MPTAFFPKPRLEIMLLGNEILFQSCVVTLDAVVELLIRCIRNCIRLEF